MTLTLNDASAEFADDLTRTVKAVFRFAADAPTFEAVKAPEASGPRTRVTVHSTPRLVPLLINADEALTLDLRFECSWDHAETYLAVDESSWAVLPQGLSEPLFRLEFVSRMKATDRPCSHLHVHAHRDEVLYALLRSERGRPAARAKRAIGEASAGGPPRLAELHFPLGGPRMRPCVEDLFSFLIGEFGVETVPGAWDVIRAKRVIWRRKQTAAAVRDSPAEAARVLAELGYTVRAPEDRHVPDALHKLGRY